MNQLFKFFIIAPFLLAACDNVSERTLNDYHLTFDGVDDRQILVVAEIEMAGNTLIVDPDEIWYIPGAESWWQGITIERIEDMDGNALVVGALEGHRLFIEGVNNQRIRIHYTVDISFVDETLPYGNSAAGASFEDGFFTVARPLFISGEGFPGARITIEKSAGLNFDAPWRLEGEGYSVDKFDHLIRAVVSFGNYQALNHLEGGLDYRLIVFGMEPEVANVLKQTMMKISEYYLETYPMPSASRYIQVAYPGPYLAGEAYPKSSVSSVVPEKIAEGGWKLTLAHELFHTWNPFLIPGTETEEMEWFKEGFTNYLTGRALVETGEISAKDWAAQSQKTYAQYIENLKNSPENITIATSGVDKDEYGDLVYHGGAAIAAWLDQEIINVSEGRKDLKLLMAAFIKTGTYLDVTSFLAVAADIDPVLAKELETYLTTKTPVPLGLAQ